MNKALYIEKLYSKLKDEVEFDEDVEALFTILKNMLKINPKKSMKYWVYLMEKYNLKELNHEIEFTPLTENYLLELLNYNDLEFILNLLQSLPNDNNIIIKKDFVNIFNKKSGIYQYIKKLIRKKEFTKEFEVLSFIINESKNDKWTFDTEVFLKNVIMIHLQFNKKDIHFLLKLTNLAKNDKDKALLQTLLIDYI